MLDFDQEVVELTDDSASKLRKLNIGAGVLHLATGIFMLVAGVITATVLLFRAWKAEADSSAAATLAAEKQADADDS